MVSYLFAGQGSQYVGMGKDLYEVFSQSKAVFDQADKTLGFALSKLCFEGPAEELTQTQNSQPAILTVSIAALEAFKSQVKSHKSQVTSHKSPARQTNVPTRCAWQEQVAYVAGLSLGEYSALVAAGALSFSAAVYLVRRRGEFMQEAAQIKPGRMLSLLGLELSAVKEICAASKTEIANLNCPGQVVISGGIREIEQAERLANAIGAKKTVFLEVSGAFHSSFMQEVALKLAQELEKIKINPAVVPVISNVWAKPAVEPREIKENLIRQIASSVLWEDSMKFILSKGIRNFLEFGPGKVLKGLLRRIDPAAEVINIEKKEDILNFNETQTYGTK